MNKAAIKNFAIWARNKLIADIQYRAGLMGITVHGIRSALPQSTKETEFYDIGTAKPYAIMGEAIKQRRSLVDVIEQKTNETSYQTAYKYIMEGVAYTWFNRLIAVRFMEINDYLPSHIRVLSSGSGKMEPDLVTTPFDADLIFSDKEKQEIIRLKNENNLDECFRLLFIKQCNALGEILPALFEKTADYTELLLNISAIDKEGVVYHLINDISEDDFNIEKGGQVEIIGWLYQYYNIEPKNEAFAKKGKITKEEIPAVTQLFTPDWIVWYMVENSLGRLWVEGHPNDLLKSKWKYYLEEAEQKPEVQEKLDAIHKEYAKLNLEDIHFIDPCMGSGHILVYAFDVLMQIYESVGYSQRDAAKSILENNLYGLDIDDRAYQMAYFAVMMKARQYNRGILSAETACHVYSIQESNNINRNQLTYFGVGLNEVEKNEALNQMEGLLDTFEYAKEYGSILNVPNYDWDLLRRFAKNTYIIDGQMTIDTMGLEHTQERLQILIDIGEIMARKYEIVVTNPPYIGNMPVKMANYVFNKYKIEKYDLYAVFMKKSREMLIRSGIVGMITQQAWLFLSSFEQMRIEMRNATIVNLLQLGAHAFDEIGGEVVQNVVFIQRNLRLDNYIAFYKDLTKGTSQEEKRKLFFIEKCICNSQESYEMIPGNVFAYRMPKQAVGWFKGKILGDYSVIKSGIVTGNNDLFLKTWFEIDRNVIDFNSKVFGEDIKWVPMHKGGGYRKHYGLHDYVMNIHDIWFSNKTKQNVRRGDPMYYFKVGLTWSTLSNKLSVRKSPEGFVFDTKGSMCFITDEKKIYYIEALLNSKVAEYYMSFLSPTLDFNQGAMSKLPVLFDEKYIKMVEIKSKENEDISKNDWNAFEISWDFAQHPLVRGASFSLKKMQEDRKKYINDINYVEDVFTNWENECFLRFNHLQSNEEELNRIFIDIYGLQDEITPEVEDKDVTVRKADLQRDIKSLLSYAVGCMFGRYSLAKEGLIFAGGEMTDVYQYHSSLLNGSSALDGSFSMDGKSYYYLEGSDYLIDEDNIIPITDEEYFADDIVCRFVEFVKMVYGADTLEENLDFIANALGNKGNTSRENIRNYFLKDFYKDHVKVYQKRPIYWLFDSGKQNGFKALIYLHRYNADTIGNLRVDYLHRMQRVYESEIGRMQDMIDHSTNSREVGVATKQKEKLQKQLKECYDYDEKIEHLALARIEIDLDDGVKVNYEKVQTAKDGKKYQVLAKI